MVGVLGFWMYFCEDGGIVEVFGVYIDVMRKFLIIVIYLDISGDIDEKSLV